jgi:dTDP-4-dehydrorhamnose reductase
MVIRPSRRTQRLLFVTGGTGYLGRHVVKCADAARWEIIAPDSQGLDLRNAVSVRSHLRDWRPAAIIHTAYRRTDRTSTVDATLHIAEAAADIGARLVHVSSDLVFRGGMSRLNEHDPPSPVDEYGRNKADAELVVASTCPNSVIVRTSLLVGGHALSNHEAAVSDVIGGRSAMTFFTDEIRCPVLVDDLAAALLELVVRPDLTGVLHLTGPDAMSRAELAVRIARHHGWDPMRLRFGTLAESGLARPARVVLDSSLAREHGLAVRGPCSWDLGEW